MKKTNKTNKQEIKVAAYVCRNCGAEESGMIQRNIEADFTLLDLEGNEGSLMGCNGRINDNDKDYYRCDECCSSSENIEDIFCSKEQYDEEKEQLKKLQRNEEEEEYSKRQYSHA